MLDILEGDSGVKSKGTGSNSGLISFSIFGGYCSNGVPGIDTLGSTGLPSFIIGAAL